MSNALVSLDTLYARWEAIANGPASSDGWAAYVALLDRLAANRSIAEQHGWMSCALERLDGGWLRLWGVRPAGTERELIPDCLAFSR
ncbi:MAG TPA: hypothetical protein VGR59_02500 [Gemmatimonadaceae bacterium]|nr:hypothetical protein [Gemmatimonadaceae bacterium]